MDVFHKTSWGGPVGLGEKTDSPELLTLTKSELQDGRSAHKDGVLPDGLTPIDLMSTQKESSGNWEEDVLRRNLFDKYYLGKINRKG